MSPVPRSNLNWWQQPGERDFARDTEPGPATASPATGDTFLVVTEGTVTEPVYFELLLGRREFSRVRVRVEPGRRSDPLHVVRAARKLADEHEERAKRRELGNNDPQGFDQVWAVIDTDAAVQRELWPDVEQLAQSLRVQLASSTPCFEFWLLLHIDGYTTRTDLLNGDLAKRAVKKALKRDYSTNKETARKVLPEFIAKWVEAVGHAQRVRRHHLDAQTPRPPNPSTDMDRLLQAVNDSLPKQLRKLQS